MLEKVLKWLFFTVVVSCLPLIFTYFNAFLHAEGTPDYSIVTEHGEVYLVASALCATGIGEMFGSRGKLQKTEIIIGALALFLAVLCSLMFAAGTKDIPSAKAYVSEASQFWALLSATVVSTICVCLAEVK